MCWSKYIQKHPQENVQNFKQMLKYYQKRKHLNHKIKQNIFVQSKIGKLGFMTLNLF